MSAAPHPRAVLRPPSLRPESLVGSVMGLTLVVAGSAMLACAAFGRLAGEEAWRPLAICGVAVGGPGLALWRGTRLPRRAGTASIFAAVLTVWLSSVLVGAVPYLATGVLYRLDLALVESTAGFTTTSATVLRGLDHLPKCLLLWRAATQWMGGIATVVFLVSVLPFLHTAGVEHLGGVVPASGERVAPRVRETAKRLVVLYLGFTAVVALLYRIFGMTTFDAVAHAMTTVSTGGFSTHDRAAAAFRTPALQIVAMGAMVVAGGNVALYWRALRGKPLEIVRSAELRFYLAVVALVGGVAVLFNATHVGWSGPLVRRTLFTTVSISTTTGYALGSYDRWAGAVQLLLLFAMATGGMAGSTAGGFKVFRIMGVVGHVRRHLHRQLHPRAVPVVRLGRQVVPDAVISRTLGFFGLFMGTGAAATFVVAAAGSLDLRTAVGAVATALGNVGPGFGRLAPPHTYLDVSAPVRDALAAVMLLGRLEIYPVLLGLVPLARWISDRLPPRAGQALVRLGRG